MKHLKKVAVLATMVGALGITSVAWAAWTADGSGSGYAKAGTSQAVSTNLVDSSALTSLLYPQGSADVKVSVHNPNPYKVRVTSITLAGAPSAVTGGGANCTLTPANTTAVTFATTAFSQTDGTASDVAAHGDTVFTLTNAASMGNASDNDCQGAVFTVAVSSILAASHV